MKDSPYWKAFVATCFGSGVVVAILLWADSREARAVDYEVQSEPLDVLLYKGCEYIHIGGAYTHKGNCTNSVHQRL